MKSKKNAKGKKEPEVVKEEPLPIKIDFSKNYENETAPMYVKVKHKKDIFMIFTEEYKKSIEIKQEVAKILNLPIENIKLYFSSKRIVEDDTMNHDQQIKHATILYACFKNSTNNEWDSIIDIINFKA